MKVNRPTGDFGIGVVGVGKYLPGQRLESSEVEARCGLESGSIEKLTGIRSRFIVRDDEHASGMSAAAGRIALASANVDPSEVGIVLGCTASADYIFPAMACKVHQLLGTVNAVAYDLLANCTAFQIGVGTVADKMRADASINYGLVVGTAIQSRYLDWKDPNSAIYFGDGSGAAVLGKVPAGYGVIATDSVTNSSVYDAVRLRGGGSSFPLTSENIGLGLQYQEINGLEVWKQVVQFQPRVIRGALTKAGKSIDDVDFFIFHQANLKLIEYLMGKMRLPMSKTYTNVAEYGNTAEASIPIALCEAVEQKLVKRDQIVVVSGVGAGFTFGATVLRWY